VTSFSTLERKHKCDPRVGNDSGVLHMDCAPWQGLVGSLAGRATYIWRFHRLIFSNFVITCIHKPKLQVELVIGKICLMTCYSSTETEVVDGVLSV
jgi:hypothetical protein